MVDNNGEMPQYLVEQSHEVIIVPEEFEAVQEEMARRKQLGRAYSDQTFTALLKSQPTAVTEWSERLWITLLDTATVMADGRIEFRLKSGAGVVHCANL